MIWYDHLIILWSLHVVRTTSSSEHKYLSSDTENVAMVGVHTCSSFINISQNHKFHLARIKVPILYVTQFIRSLIACLPLDS